MHLSVLDRDEVVYVHKLDSPNPVRAYTQIGGRARAYCVVTGKAMLAFRSQTLPEQMALSLEARTSTTVVDPTKFLQEMARIRVRDFALIKGEGTRTSTALPRP